MTLHRVHTSETNSYSGRISREKSTLMNIKYSFPEHSNILHVLVEELLCHVITVSFKPTLMGYSNFCNISSTSKSP